MAQQPYRENGGHHVPLPMADEIDRLTRELQEARAALTALQSYQVQYDDLQDENAKLQGERDRLLVLLREVEWGSYSEFGASCPVCGGMDPRDDANPSWVPVGGQPSGHAPDCRLKAALEE